MLYLYLVYVNIYTIITYSTYIERKLSICRAYGLSAEHTSDAL